MDDDIPYLLLTPGPLTTSRTVRQAMMRDYCTWDEDYNNLSLGIGSEGNNVPMIVVPNQGAVTLGGMQSGHFTTNSYYNQYSLMATIEDALSPTPGALAPLTYNDMYAQPMNAFWK